MKTKAAPEVTVPVQCNMSNTMYTVHRIQDITKKKFGSIKKQVLQILMLWNFHSIVDLL